jgi:hypothetical protein
MMRNLGLALAAVLAVVSFVTSAGASDVDRQQGATYDRPAVEIGGGIANDGGSGEINVIAPLVFSEGKDLLFFGADAKFSGFDINDTDDTVYNVGGYLGYRALLDGGNGVLGLWAGLDYFNTEQSNEFARAIAGIEYFGPHVIAKANAFVPFDSTSAEWTTTSGGFITTYDEKVPSGFDAELGLRMAVPMGSFAKPGEFRIFAGGYDFIGLDDDGGDVLGGRARAELDLYLFDESPDTRLSLEASYAYDKHSGDQYGAGIKLSIPLGVTNKLTTHGAKDETVAELDSFGQDLFQPVRRNRENVSRIRQKSRVPVTTGATGGVTLSNVCGGASGNLTLTAGLASTTIRQGANIGTIDPTGAATALNLSLGDMVDASGRTLTQLLASSPQTINTTLSFPASTVNFATQTVEPAASVRSTTLGADQKISRVSVMIDGNSCSVDIENTVAPLTLATICGGPNTPIPIVATGYDFNTNSNLPISLNSSSINQNALVGQITNYDPVTFQPLPKRDVNLVLGSMVNSAGQTLTQLLAANLTSLSTTLTFPASVYDPNKESIVGARPMQMPQFGDCTVLSTLNLVVNNQQCTLEVSAGNGCIPVSDARLKRDIQQIATTADGYKIYSFKYLENMDANNVSYVGVMAQDLISDHPEAIVTMLNGFYAVRYDRLGLRMTTLDEYRRKGLGAVEGH